MNDATLEIDDLSRRFGRRWAVVHARVTVPAGGSLMLTGANGSGKTTLLRCLSTALRPHLGTARLGGRDLWAERESLRPQVALLTHASRLYEDLSARENLHAWAAMGGLKADVGPLLARVGLEDAADHGVRTFSAGMKRRLALALLLLKNPALCLLDEPFSALDPGGRELVADVVRELRARRTTIVLSTHHPAIAADLCDQAIQLAHGQILWRGKPSDLPAIVEAS